MGDRFQEAVPHEVDDSEYGAQEADDGDQDTLLAAGADKCAREAADRVQGVGEAHQDMADSEEYSEEYSDPDSGDDSSHFDRKFVWIFTWGFQAAGVAMQEDYVNLRKRMVHETFDAYNFQDFSCFFNEC